MAPKAATQAQQDAIDVVEKHSAHNYSPLPVVIASGQGAIVTDIDGREYIDCLSAYSAVNFGHSNPALVEVATRQLQTLTLTSRAFHSAPFGPFAQALSKLSGKQMILPMNSGAEAVETALKTARKWGYQVKGVPDGRAKIIVMDGNFHGRTTTIISFSNDPEARDDYAPYTTGFVTAPYGDAAALEALIDDDTVAVLLEPIQGEAGVLIPAEGYLREVREITKRRGVLMIADEIQSGFGRSGETFACDREGVVPDMYIMGKALGGGIVALSAVAADEDVLGVFQPGQHGSTFGGNPLACAIGTAVCELMATGEMQRRSREMGDKLHAGLKPLLDEGLLTKIRHAGLWFGLDVDPTLGTARELCYALLERGILAKDTHDITIRFAPPLTITDDELQRVIDATVEVFHAAAEKAGR